MTRIDEIEKRINEIHANTGGFNNDEYEELLSLAFEKTLLKALPGVELDEVCEHGCHAHDVYGFIITAGCPVHDD